MAKRKRQPLWNENFCGNMSIIRQPHLPFSNSYPVLHASIHAWNESSLYSFMQITMSTSAVRWKYIFLLSINWPAPRNKKRDKLVLRSAWSELITSMCVMLSEWGTNKTGLLNHTQSTALLLANQVNSTHWWVESCFAIIIEFQLNRNSSSGWMAWIGELRREIDKKFLWP